MEKFKLLILLAVVIVAANCSSESDSSSNSDSSSESNSSSSSEDENECEEPLFLSKYIESGQIEKGQKLAAVNYPDLLKMGIKSYSGYLTVNKTYDSNLFFWYFPAKNNQKKAPVILWLQGGPGASSLYGLFMENGPVYINSENKLSEREFSWNRNLNLLFIDNPVGAGFSFTNSSSGYLTNQVDVGKYLFSAVRQFFQLFPELKDNEFYVSGESYAGKYVPALAYTTYLNSNSSDVHDRINLKGISIGNGITDPINQIYFGQLFHELGFIDAKALATFNTYQNISIALIQQGKFVQALSYTFALINTRNCLFNNLTGFTSPYNYLMPNGYNDQIQVVSNYLVNSTISKYLHVCNRTFVPFADNNQVLYNLVNDILDSVAPWVAELIDNNYEVLIYSGQLDLLAGPRLIENYLLNLNFTGADAFRAAARNIWRVDGDIAGYVQKALNLTFAVVRLAGHMVPLDQPKWTFELISNLTKTGP